MLLSSAYGVYAEFYYEYLEACLTLVRVRPLWLHKFCLLALAYMLGLPYSVYVPYVY